MMNRANTGTCQQGTRRLIKSCENSAFWGGGGLFVTEPEDVSGLRREQRTIEILKFGGQAAVVNTQRTLSRELDPAKNNLAKKLERTSA